MRLIQSGLPVVGLSSNSSIPGERPGFVAIDVTVRIEPPPKRLPQLDLACSVGSKDTVHRVFEQSKLVHSRLTFMIPREHCPEGGSVTLSAALDGTSLWQKCYRVRWKQSEPFVEELA
jgi:hypothetical protein